MTADPWVELEHLIDAAFSQDPQRRAAAIAACPNDQLRAQLERLIREYDDLGSFMSRPPVRLTDLRTHTISRESLRAGQILKGCYRIIRLLGKGGMGEVYEAEDLQLEGCRIALKTLRSGLPSAGRALERFKREILLARRVTHPNVCRVYHLDRDTGEEQEEIVFLTMEFLDGETLHQRIKRLGPMDAATVDPIARGIIAGLAACHKRGIVHRDFKTGNVMLVNDDVEGPRAVITDFGLAHTPDVSDGPALSAPGGIMGTPEYMAPEQREGKPATAASDIYALGIVLCEMLTGRRPADGPPVPPESGWAALIARCLQPEPPARFSNAVELEQSLAGRPPARNINRRRSRWLISAAALLILVVVSVLVTYRSKPVLPELKHVAILAFHNLGRNPADQVFCEGLAETLTSKLSQLERYQKSFWVVPASESRQATSPDEAYRKLDATLVVTGTLERMPGKTVLLINLIDPRTRRQLASRDIPTTADLSGLEDDAWQRVADMLDLELGPLRSKQWKPAAHAFQRHTLRMPKV